VPGRHDLRGECRPAAHLLADQEEGCPHAVARQGLEHQRGALRVRPVIEGKGHALRAGQPQRQREADGHPRDDRSNGGKESGKHERRSSIHAIAPGLDTWLPHPTIRVAHRRPSRVPAPELWEAARTVRLADTQLLGRLVRWRIPGTPAELAYDEMFRRPPFLVLEEGDQALISGIVGRIWTLRRDYPALSEPSEFQGWSQRGTARVVFANWAEPLDGGGAALCSEVRVEAVGGQGQVGLATVRPLVRGFHHLIGSDGIGAAVRRAEQSRT
jgi:hypothetical protein